MMSPINAPARYDFVALLNGDQTDANTLHRWLLETRDRTRALTDDLEGDRAFGPRLAIVNPPLWELGHVVWFQEYWCLRFRNGEYPLESMIHNADNIYNSAIAAHDTRWDLPLLSWRGMGDYQDAVLERVLERVARGEPDAQLRYFVLLSILHEDMHGEAFYYTRQTLGYPRIGVPESSESRTPQTVNQDVQYSGGTYLMGARRGEGFVFDNECWAHDVIVEPFQMQSAPVSVAQFATFVGDGGYARAELWSREGGTWREVNDVQGPRYWTQHDGQWWIREFDREVPLSLRAAEPMIFVNAHEAQAYCNWVQRRLPSEAEWEFAAAVERDASTRSPRVAGDAKEQHCSPLLQANTEYHGWNWTANVFEPYGAFSPGPYVEYSAPWFRNHRVLRGCSFVTRPRLRRATYRNFYTPDRNDVLAGFRTCTME